MNHPDYTALLGHAAAHPGAAPQHPSHAIVHHDPHAGAHPAAMHPHAAPPHQVHVVHDARHPGGAPAQAYAPQAEVHHHYPPAEHHYPHGFEHEPEPGYSRHRQHRHEHHEDEGRPRKDRRSWPHPKHQTSPDDIRMFPIGFVMTGIAAGDTEEIEVKPQVRFQGRRLAVAQSIARYFDIMDIKVGKDSQLAATGALSGECLSGLAVDVRVELDPAPPGIVITLTVKNNDTATAHDFRAVLYGLVEEVEE